MRTDDPAYFIARRIQNGVYMLGNGRTGVDDGHFIIAEQVGIGAGACHHTGIGCNQAPDSGVKAKWNAVFQHPL
jgi:hypothetical protein